ncbi:hypothetical protein D3C87_2124960 [compost metagenome]
MVLLRSLVYRGFAIGGQADIGRVITHQEQDENEGRGKHGDGQCQRRAPAIGFGKGCQHG